MNTKGEISQNHERMILQEINDYQITTYAILALISFFTCDKDSKKILPNVHHCIGRRMTTSINNKILPDDDVTPDIVIQRAENDGYIIEVKKGLPQNKELWQKDVMQLIKYDDALKGWWTSDELLDNNHNLIVMIHQSRAIDFFDFLKNELESQNEELINGFAVIQYTRDIALDTFINLQKIEGNIGNEDLNKALRSSRQIPIEKVVANPDYKDLKFYDSEPQVVEYTMYLLWMHVFPDLMSREGHYDEDKNCNTFTVSLASLTSDLQKAYGSEANQQREASFPQTAWVRKALDKFVDIQLAIYHDDDEYAIFYEEISGDALGEIIRRVSDLNEQISELTDAQQMDLFKDKAEQTE